MKNNKTLHTFVVLAYKDSPYLEECIKSTLNQKYKSDVIIATTTPNDHITKLAKKYSLKITKGEHTNIGGDFDFAKNSANTELITIAHQDDIYDSDYSLAIVNYYKKYIDASIIFTDYYEIRNNKKCLTNKNLKIKRLLLAPLKLKKFTNLRVIKRLSLKFGDAISCPAVSFVKKNTPKDLFKSNFKANVDWFAWEKLSKNSGRFVFINKKLMGHRISESSETTKIINSGERSNEDYEIFCKFWPRPIASLLTSLYRKAEKSNQT